MLEFFIVPVLGVIAGFLSGLLGIGGGIVIVPALIYLLPNYTEISSEAVPIVAIATSLATIIVTTFSSAKSHYSKGNVDKRLALPVASSIAIVSIVMPFVASKMSGHSLTITFAIIMVVLAVQMVLASKKHVVDEILPSKAKLVIGGGITGLIASVAGLGGGAILVPYLTFIKVNIHKAVATAAACGVVVSFFGTIGYFISGFHWSTSYQFIGFVHWPTAIGIMIFSYITAPFGVKVGHNLNQKQLKKVFAGFMILVAIKLVMEL
jgi:uncharacterized membrane protein YfcA